MWNSGSMAGPVHGAEGHTITNIHYFTQLKQNNHIKMGWNVYTDSHGRPFSHQESHRGADRAERGVFKEDFMVEKCSTTMTYNFPLDLMSSTTEEAVDILVRLTTLSCLFLQPLFLPGAGPVSWFSSQLSINQVLFFGQPEFFLPLLLA